MFLAKTWRNHSIAFLIGLVLFIASCGGGETTRPAAETNSVQLTPYSSPTASQTTEVLSKTLVEPTQLPTPTPTPIVYEIQQGDTMLAIAFKYGISLEALQSANPEVNARLLVVGTELIIPLEDVIPSNPITATPIPVQIIQTKCYPALDGIWCFVILRNDRSRPLENLSAKVIIQDSSGDFLTEGVAFGAINLLPMDEELPLVVFLPGKYSNDLLVTSNILTVQLLPKNDDRYLNAWIEMDEIDISESGLSAQVGGRIGLPAKSPPGNLAWILLVAYDNEKNVVGFRKVEQLERLEPGTSRNFNINISSLDSSISEVRAFVEVRP
jgi:LysM repeat protein